jgi:hypothetical protein
MMGDTTEMQPEMEDVLQRILQEVQERVEEIAHERFQEVVDAINKLIEEYKDALSSYEPPKTTCNTITQCKMPFILIHNLENAESPKE